jgi:hypothetical protein
MLLVTQVLAHAGGLRLEGIGPTMRWAMVCKLTNSFRLQVLYSVLSRKLIQEVLMSELKTKANDASVQVFLEGVTDDQRRKDCLAIVELLRKISNAEAKMWGANIIGFGSSRLQYPDGREIDWMQVGFSPRKQNLTLYIRGGLEMHEKLLHNLGKFKTGKGCLYINKLEDIHLPTLEKLITASIDGLKT